MAPTKATQVKTLGTTKKNNFNEKINKLAMPKQQKDTVDKKEN